jgi:hypothetical protein
VVVTPETLPVEALGIGELEGAAEETPELAPVPFEEPPDDLMLSKLPLISP